MPQAAVTVGERAEVVGPRVPSWHGPPRGRRGVRSCRLRRLGALQVPVRLPPAEAEGQGPEAIAESLPYRIDRSAGADRHRNCRPSVGLESSCSQTPPAAPVSLRRLFRDAKRLTTSAGRRLQALESSHPLDRPASRVAEGRAVLEELALAEEDLVRYENAGGSARRAGLARSEIIPLRAMALLELGDLDAAAETASLALRSRERWAAVFPETDVEGVAFDVMAGHQVLGRCELESGNRNAAIRHLGLSVSMDRWSPIMRTVGPWMGLAQLLLAAGERVAVLDFLHRCEEKWPLGRGKVRGWVETLDAGGAAVFLPSREAQ